MGEAASLSEESFEDGLLEHPQYTRPRTFEGLDIPEVLLSGHHGEVAKWRQAEREKTTRERRPDLGRRISPINRQRAIKPSKEMTMNMIEELEKEEADAPDQPAHDPEFQPGDTLRVNVRIKEGERERVQAYEGVCIARAGGGLHESFTVRKISFGEGVERVFPVLSPMIESIEVKRRGAVRRAKLYYLRDRRGKSARIAERAMGARDGARRNRRKTDRSSPRERGDVSQASMAAAVRCATMGRPTSRANPQAPTCRSVAHRSLALGSPAHLPAAARGGQPPAPHVGGQAVDQVVEHQAHAADGRAGSRA